MHLCGFRRDRVALDYGPVGPGLDCFVNGRRSRAASLSLRSLVCCLTVSGYVGRRTCLLREKIYLFNTSSIL
jgi:hypothetical protein